MQLREALTQIAEIRQQMARGAVFRGYRALTVGLTGVLGIVAAVFQSHWVPAPQRNLDGYLDLWCGVAVISLLVSGAELFCQARATGPGLARQRTWLAVGQFLPCIIVGGLLTFCIYRAAPDVAWMLPGLWALLFGLGMFASCVLLPRQVAWSALYYVACGCGCLVWGQEENAFSPWLMGVTFGGGQLLTAAILYWNLERTDGAQEKA